VTKKVRSATRAHRRPGTRAPVARDPARRRSVERPSALEAATEIAEAYVEDAPAVTTSAEAPMRPARIPQAHARHRAKPGRLLAARAASEYLYVAQDMRRILVVAALLVGVLLVLWALIVVMKVIPLSFY